MPKFEIRQDRSRQKEELWLAVFKNALQSSVRIGHTEFQKSSEVAAKEADEALRQFVERFEPAPVTIQ